MKLGRRLTVIVPAIVILVALGGLTASCGGGGSSGSSGGSSGVSTKASSNVTVPAGATVIDQDNLTFKPDKAEIQVNQKMYFLNSESAIHTVTINGKNISGNMKKGDVVVWSSPTPGEYKVTCDYHPQMKATITVK